MKIGRIAGRQIRCNDRPEEGYHEFFVDAT
jgi:hypothetical protein